MTRWVTGTRPDQEGRFQRPATCRPGSYYAVAVDYMPQGEWGDPELLERLKARATRFTLDDGGTRDARSEADRELLTEGLRPSVEA